MKITRLVAVFGFLALFFASSLAAADFAGLSREVEKIFPEKYDETLSRLYRPEDRLVFIFREMSSTRLNEIQKIDPVLNRFLAKALNRYWLLESNEFKKVFSSDPLYYQHRIKKYFEKLPSSYDKGAFSHMLESLKEKFAGLSPFAQAAAVSLQALNENRELQLYIKEIKSSGDFYKKIPLFLKPVQKIEEKVEALIDRLQQKFLIERMIIALDTISAKQDGKIKQSLLKFKNRLSERLLKMIVANLEVQLETTLEPDAVTGISITPNGMVISQVLYQGRIRTFVKELQKAENMQQLQSLMPMIPRLRSEVARLKSAQTNQQNKSTLEKMYQNLDQMTTILRLKLRNKNEISQDSAKAMQAIEKELFSDNAQQVILEAL